MKSTDTTVELTQAEWELVIKQLTIAINGLTTIKEHCAHDGPDARAWMLADNALTLMLAQGVAFETTTGGSA